MAEMVEAAPEMETAPEQPTLNLKVLSPSSELEGGIHLHNLPAATTVRELRLRIQDKIPSRPGPERMRLIYRGKVVANDADSLEAVFGTDNLRESKDQSLHLVLREQPHTGTTPSPAQTTTNSAQATTNPAQTPNPASQTPPPGPPLQTAPNPAQTTPNPSLQTPHNPPLQTNPFRAIPQPRPHHHHHHHHVPPNPGAPPHPDAPAPAFAAVRQEGIAPNGTRWSVTYNDFTANVPLRPGQPTLPRPFPFAIPRVPVQPGVSTPLNSLLLRVRASLQDAGREMDNVRTLLAPSAVEDALSSAQPRPAFPTWRADRIRRHLRIVTHTLDMVENDLSDPALQLNVEVVALRQVANGVWRQANELSRALDEQQPAPSVPDPLLATASAAASTLPSAAPQELFLLSSPQGPVGVLYDHRGTYTAAPFTPSLSAQSFIDQFNQNRQLIASLGQQIVQSSHNLHSQLGTQAGTQRGAQPNPQPALDPAAQRIIQNILQGNERPAGEPAPAAPAAPAEDRVVNVAGHLWLIFKLACFVYIFAGGGGWYRPLMLGSIAIIVYVVQLGVFEPQLNLIRGHFEALLPNAERLARDNQNQNQAAPDPRRVTPEEAARRLVLQQRNNQFGWARDSLRTLERGVAIFVASLWPGIGERMVHAQEERERLERVAASEREERRAEEARQQEEKKAEAQAGEQNGERTEAETEKPLVERNATPTLSEDFMETGSGAGTTAAAASNKGKARAPDSEYEADS